MEGDVQAAKVYLDRVLGPAKATDPIRIAEHLRQVERDRVEIALKILGERIMTWESGRASAFLADCARDPHGFLQKAEEYLDGTGAEREPEQPPAEPLQATP